MKSNNLKQFLCFNVLFYPVSGKISILGGWWRKTPRNRMSCTQERVGVVTNGLLTWSVKPFIEDSQPRMVILGKIKDCKSTTGMVSYYSG